MMPLQSRQFGGGLYQAPNVQQNRTQTPFNWRGLTTGILNGLGGFQSNQQPVYRRPNMQPMPLQQTQPQPTIQQPQMSRVQRILQGIGGFM